MVNAVDCTGLNEIQISNLAKNGIKYVGRYLSRSTWKGLSLGEIANIKAAGMQIFSIYETNPTYAGYFVPGKGKSDATDALTLAKAAGQPEGSAIYFTVDYDAQAADLANILNYFREVSAQLDGLYHVGAYGSFTVLNYLHENNAAEYWFQTVGWSRGQRCNFLNIFQYQVDKTNWNGTGANVDLNDLEKSDIGAWGQDQPAQQPAADHFIMVVRAIGQGDIRDQPSHTAGFIRNTKDGELFNVIQIQNDWHQVALDSTRKGWIDGNNGKNLFWVDNPALNAQPAAAQAVFHVVASGETVSKLATKYGSTVAQIQAWNNLSNPNLIKIGQRLRVK